jgi:hypothetical protein
MPFAIGGNQLVDAVYEVSNSLRFNDDDSPRLQITTGSNSNRQRFTFSTWVKKCQDTGDDQTLFSANDGGHQPHIKFDTEFEQLNVRISDSDNYNVMTNRVFRDVSAWYHIVVAMDTTQSTASNRIKIYVNGVQETSLRTANYPAQNYNSAINTNTEHTLGRDVTTNNKPLDGYMAETFFIDGTQLQATDFGEFNDNGVWIPIDAKNNLTFGTHGFYFEYKQTGTSANSSGIGADTSGNDNHFTPTNLTATDITTDTCTNNFNTLNPLANQMGGTLSEGNTQCVGAAASDKHVFGTFGLTQGKWYWEIKVTDQGARGSVFISDSDHNDVIGTNYAGHAFHSGGTVTSATSNSNVGSGASDNDIICFAADLDNGQLFMSKNADIDTSGTANVTGLATSGLDRDYRISQRETGNPASTMQHNYGNAPFSISSSNSDSEGHGSFEFAVPSGYFALCTKNLAEYG